MSLLVFHVSRLVLIHADCAPLITLQCSSPTTTELSCQNKQLTLLPCELPPAILQLSALALIGYGLISCRDLSGNLISSVPYDAFGDGSFALLQSLYVDTDRMSVWLLMQQHT